MGHSTRAEAKLKDANAALVTAAAQRSQSEDPKSMAALQFVNVLLQRLGQVTDDDFDKIKSHGWSDEEIGEIVAHVALNVFSNYFNHVAAPSLDFPAAVVAR